MPVWWLACVSCVLTLILPTLGYSSDLADHTYQSNVSFVSAPPANRTKRASASCRLPLYPHNKYLLYRECPPPVCEPRPGDMVLDGDTYDVTCEPGYQMFSPDDGPSIATVLCENGQWDEPIPECYKVPDKTKRPTQEGELEPLEPLSTSNSVTGCTVPPYLHNRYTLVKCLGPACTRLPGQKSPIQRMINYTCDPGYYLKTAEDNPTFVMVNCKKNGEWWKPIPECVKKSKKTRTSAGCLLPAHPPHVNGYKLWKCNRETCVMLPGRSLPHKSNLFISCEEGYESAADQDTPVCIDGRWSRSIPQCYNTCPALRVSNNMEAVCGMDEKPCDQPQPYNTTATFRCPEFNSPSSDKPLTCGADGKWSGTIPVCQLSCGVVKGNDIDVASVTGVGQANVAQFPWHAAIFRKINGDWTNVCSGSLITNKHILTAADCVVRRRPCFPNCHPPIQQMRPSDLMVALGKTRRQWNPQEQNEVRKGVKGINIKNSYYNLYVRQKDYANAAVLRLDSDVAINSFILPVCVDLTHSRSAEISSINTGIMSGWSRGAECNAGDRCNVFESDNLLYDKLTIDTNAGCHALMRNLPKYDYVIESSPYHFCRRNARNVKHMNDPGAGFTYKIRDQHYIVGIFIREVQENGGFGLLFKSQSAAGIISEEVEGASPRPMCKLPDFPNNIYRGHDGCSGDACSPRPGGMVADSQLVTVTCKPGYNIVNSVYTHFVCKQGNWSNPIRKCDDVCPPLTSTTMDLYCYQGPEPVGCNRTHPLGTNVVFKCKPYYSPESGGDPSNPRCLAGGQWSRRLPSCTPYCGVSNLNSADVTPAIIDGTPARGGNFPWHAALFHKKGGLWDNVCGGSLITTSHVLTAAHCVVLKCDNCQPETMRPEDIKVGLGKNHRDWRVDEKGEVKRSVVKIYVGPNFRGHTGAYDEDIAVLKLESEIQVTPTVMPVCLDLENEHYHKITSPGNKGIVAGWGNTVDCPPRGDACGVTSESLQYATTRIYEYQKCKDTIDKKTMKIAAQIAAGNLCTDVEKNSVIQKGDSGGGLIFQFGKHYFIYGIVSVKLNLRNQNSVGSFTNIRDHLLWIRDKITPKNEQPELLFPS